MTRPPLACRFAATAIAAATVAASAAVMTTAPAAASAPSNVLTILQSAAPVSLNPVIENDWNSRESIGYMYDPLIYEGPNNSLRPGLATSWKGSDHAMVWTFQLRHGVTFQDGTPWNAQAAVYNFQLDMKTTSLDYTDFVPWVKSVKAIGQYTLQITLAKPDAEFIPILTWAPLMVSPTAYRKEGAAGFAQHPVGTGAYEFVSYAPNSTLIMKANPHYWGGAPKIPEIKVEIVPSLTTEALDMEAHTADFMYGPQASDLAALRSHGVKIEQTPTPSGDMVYFNLSKAPTNDVNVRRAIMLALDRAAMVKVVFDGYAQLDRAGVPNNSPFYHANVPEIPYSPARAKAILAADGWKVGAGGVRYKDGKPLAITILSNSNAPWPEVSQILQEELSKVGFEARIVTQDWGTFLNSGRAGDYSIAYWGLGGFSTYTWDGTVNMYSKDYWNISQMKDNPSMAGIQRQIDAIYNKEVGQSNVAQRSATLLQFQRLDYKDVLVGWLWTPLEVFAVSPSLHNYAFNDWMYLFLNSHSTLGGR